MKGAAGLTSFLVGTVAALTLLAGWRMPAGHANAATALTVSVGGSRTVRLSRTGTVFDVAHMRPGRTLTATIVLHNTRPVALHLRPRARVTGDDSATDAMQVRVAAGGQTLFSGSLTRLAQPTARRIWLEPGRLATVTLQVVLPPSNRRRAAGRAADMALGFEVDP